MTISRKSWHYRFIHYYPFEPKTNCDYWRDLVLATLLSPAGLAIGLAMIALPFAVLKPDLSPPSLTSTLAAIFLFVSILGGLIITFCSGLFTVFELGVAIEPWWKRNVPKLCNPVRYVD